MSSRLLWSNDEPTKTFNPKTITLLDDITTYDAILIEYYISTSNQTLQRAVYYGKPFITGTTTSWFWAIAGYGGELSSICTRPIAIVDGESMYIAQCRDFGARSMDNYMIPAAVYGLKGNIRI